MSESGSGWLKPSILQKGLGLILVPVILQAVFFFQFYSLVGKLEEVNLEEAKQSLLVEQLNKMLQLFTISWGTLLAETLESTKIGAMDSETFKQKTQEGLSKLTELAPTPSFRAIIGRAQSMADQQYQLLKEFSETDPGESSAAIYAKCRRMKLALRPYMKQIMYINQALSLERDRLNETQKQAAEHRNFIKMQLACGVTIDIFLTLALLIFFLKNITDRLSLLVNNARLLPTGQPLPSSVPGSDELAYLDQVLHQASTELERAAEYRQSMMETMSHDLRSPIQSALIIAEVFDALPVVQQSEKLSRQLDSLKRNLTRVVRLVEDHLTMDKLESGTVELAVSSFDLRDLVAETIDCVAAQAMLKSIELSNKVEAIEVEADKERILQVLTNFLTNAIKYSPRSAPVLISSQHLGHSVKIMVLDDGPGLEGDELARIFERFQQTSTGAKSREGFGLGLAICKLLVNQHGGTVGVTSTPGKGSTFWFTLPIRYTPQK